nr:MAG TPA: hypothetical protein [Caudoviricetes sp.]
MLSCRCHSWSFNPYCCCIVVYIRLGTLSVLRLK